jgi:hypothetical protein
MADERKSAFIVNTIRQAQGLASIADAIADLENEYFDNGYDGAGADSIIDADVAAHDITAAQFTSYITLMQQLKNFFGNSAVTTGDYAATLNALRRAPGV